MLYATDYMLYSMGLILVKIMADRFPDPNFPAIYDYDVSVSDVTDIVTSQPESFKYQGISEHVCWINYNCAFLFFAEYTSKAVST